MTWRADAARVLDAAGSTSDIGSRAEIVSELLLGIPYLRNPLGGAPGRRERLVLALTRFDCVTYVESVVALSLSGSPEEFRRCLAGLRYGGRDRSWEHRLHYVSEWLERNQSRGILERVEPGLDAASVRKHLTCVAGVAPRTVLLRIHPWAATGGAHSAHLAAFVSLRDDVDVFHVGVLAGDRLRHASRAAGAVIEEPLHAFLARERGAGMLLARIRGV